jgi:hypothetical protein
VGEDDDDKVHKYETCLDRHRPRLLQRLNVAQEPFLACAMVLDECGWILTALRAE